MVFAETIQGLGVQKLTESITAVRTFYGLDINANKTKGRTINN